MAPPGEEVKWYYKPINVILLLIFVTGPFGLPLVYKSPKFNKVSKILLTLLMIPYTWYLVILTKKTVEQTKQTITQLEEVLK